MFLIDTVTLSELRRRQRDPVVVAWFERQRTADLFLSVISIGEIILTVVPPPTGEDAICADVNQPDFSLPTDVRELVWEESIYCNALEWVAGGR